MDNSSFAIIHPDKEAAAMTAAAGKAWSPFNFEGENVDSSVKRVFGNIDPLETTTTDPDLEFKNLAIKGFI